MRRVTALNARLGGRGLARLCGWSESADRADALERWDRYGESLAALVREGVHEFEAVQRRVTEVYGKRA